MTGYPQRRLRRLRSTPGVRELLRETRLAPPDFIAPLFVVERDGDAGPVAPMPGVERYTLKNLPGAVERLAACGVRGVMLFGVPATKDADASCATEGDSIVARAVRSINEATDRVAVFTDVCLCSYTDHGHCGSPRDGRIDNDATLDVIAQMAVAHARAGADFVAPSGMMDGMVGAIRRALDENELSHVGILSYAVKYASAFYGPFREAADSTPQFGDRRSYQLDPAATSQALAEAQLDVDEGADMLMVKPALPYLDIVRRVRDRFPDHPLAAYQVSGEYSMIKAAAANGWLDERSAALESLTAIKRSGADMIITYFAQQAATWLTE